MENKRELIKMYGKLKVEQIRLRAKSKPTPIDTLRMKNISKELMKLKEQLEILKEQEITW